MEKNDHTPLRRPVHLNLQTIRHMLVLLGVCAVMAVFFSVLYRYDNKYTKAASVDGDSVTLADTAALSLGQIFSLTDGWELYPDQLAGQEELSHSEPVPVFIGQHLSLSPFHEDSSPYGISSWHTTIRPDTPGGTYTILLPEVFSACRVLVDGVPAAHSGQLDPYRPRIMDLSFPVTLDREVSVIVQTANYSHYYSGLTYPPVIGTDSAVRLLSAFRMVFYGFLCFSSLSVSLFSIAVWAGIRSGKASRKNSSGRCTFWFGLLSLSFALRVCYPFFRLVGAPLVRSLYALEDGASLLTVCSALHIVCILTGLDGKAWTRKLLSLAAGMCGAGILIPLFILPAFPAFTEIYGILITCYKLSAALFLAGAAVFTGSSGSIFLLAGTAAFGMGLFASMASIGYYEPFYGGWFDEYGSFAMVLCFAVLMIRSNFALVRENELLTLHLQDEVEKKTRDISLLAEERQKLLSELLHDLKSPMSSVMTCVQLIRHNGILLNGRTEEQLQTVEDRCMDVTRRLSAIQDFTREYTLAGRMEFLELNEFLTEFHSSRQPDVEAVGPDFNWEPSASPCLIRGDREKLERALENLIYNAVDFTPPQGLITMSLKLEGNRALLKIRDTGCGISPDLLPRIFNRFYTSRPEEGGQGLGLSIVRAIIREHGGEIEAASAPGEGTVFFIRLPLSGPL